MHVAEISEVVESSSELHRNRSKLPHHRIVSWFRRAVLGQHPLPDDHDPALAKERLLSRAFTRREQAAYQRAVSTERAIQRAAVAASGEILQVTGAGVDSAVRNCETATGIFLDSGVREARRLGHLFKENRVRSSAAKLSVVQ